MNKQYEVPYNFSYDFVPKLSRRRELFPYIRCIYLPAWREDATSTRKDIEKREEYPKSYDEYVLRLKCLQQLGLPLCVLMQRNATLDALERYYDLGIRMFTISDDSLAIASKSRHPDISVTPQQLVSYYYEEGAREGIRPDVAFAQALKETGFFRYGGTVTSDQNNYCGLGTTSSQVKGAYFNSAQMGVRAQIQHLLAYASTRLPNEPVVDPRYNLVRSSYGERTLKSWPELNGRWAVPGYTYGQSIMSIFRAMLAQ